MSRDNDRDDNVNRIKSKIKSKIKSRITSRRLKRRDFLKGAAALTLAAAAARRHDSSSAFEAAGDPDPVALPPADRVADGPYDTPGLVRPPYDENMPNQLELVIHDSADAFGEEAFYHVTRALEDAKIAYHGYDLASAGGPEDLGVYSGIIFATENIYLMDGTTALAIDKYVREGGSLTVLIHGWNPLLRETFGMYNRREPGFVSITEDIELGEGILMGYEGLEKPTVTIPHGVLGDFPAMDVILLDGVKVLAKVGDVPIIWLHEHGKGRVLYWNNDWSTMKMFRGLVIQSVLAAHKAAASSMINAATFDLDDFPLPSSMYPQYPTNVEFNMNTADFFYKVWWPDMQYLARRYGIKYTAVIPFNYNGSTAPPFDFAEWEWARVKVNGQEDVLFTVHMAHLVYAEGHELGLHGYNHQSLMTTHGWTWADSEAMSEALDRAHKRWVEDSLGELPFSYVAPNNMLGPEGLVALKKSFPTIRVFKGIGIAADFAESGDREFGPEPWNDYFFAMPRWSDGYVTSDEIQLLMLSQIAYFGLWTHFVHPDDVLNNSTNYPGEPMEELRNPNNMWWRGDHTSERNGMYYTLNNLLSYVEKNFPWLRYMTTREAFAEFADYFSTQVYYDFRNPEEVKVTFEGKPGYFYLRFNDGRRLDMKKLYNAQTIHLYEGDGYVLYIIRATGEDVRLGTFTP